MFGRCALRLLKVRSPMYRTVQYLHNGKKRPTTKCDTKKSIRAILCDCTIDRVHL
jgi:hypothetical protein